MTYTPKEIERALGISNSQLHHWEKALKMKPLQESSGRGYTTIYSEENFVMFRLLHTLFCIVGLNLTVASKHVIGLFSGADFSTIHRIASTGKFNLTLESASRYEGFAMSSSQAM